MKKSHSVPATFVATIAALSLAGCSSNRRDCVDSTGRRIPDVECTRPSGAYTYPHWVYRSGGTNRSGSIPWSSRNSTGTSTGTPGTSVGGVSRGGFGSSSSGSSSFGG